MKQNSKQTLSNCQQHYKQYQTCKQFKQSQNKYELSSIIGCKPTIKKFRSAATLLISSRLYDDSFQSNQTIADIARVGLTVVKESKQEMQEKGTLFVIRPNHAPTPSRIVLLERDKFQEAMDLLQAVLGKAELERIRNELLASKRPLLKLNINLLLVPYGSRTSRRLSPEDYAHLRDSGSCSDGTVQQKMSNEEFDQVWYSTGRPQPVGKIIRPSDEATTQMFWAETLKQERDDEQLQSDTGFYSGDNRAESQQVGPDQALRLSGSSDTGCQEGPQFEQECQGSVRSVFQDSDAVLREQWYTADVESSGYPQGGVQDAGGCEDDVAGYEGEWTEIFD